MISTQVWRRLRRLLRLDFGIDANTGPAETPDGWVRPVRTLAGELAAASAATVYVQDPVVTPGRCAGVVVVCGPLLVELMPAGGGDPQLLVAEQGAVEVVLGEQVDQLAGDIPSTVTVHLNGGFATEVVWSAV